MLRLNNAIKSEIGYSYQFLQSIHIFEHAVLLNRYCESYLDAWLPFVRITLIILFETKKEEINEENSTEEVV